ncbi:hypothetical protein Trydic_g1362 [Trypoxylus dichotomus]
MERVTNISIREILKENRDIVDHIRNKQLILFGRAQRMSEARLPKQVLKWKPRGRRKQGSPRRCWQGAINEEMRERRTEDL